MNYNNMFNEILDLSKLQELARNCIPYITDQGYSFDIHFKSQDVQANIWDDTVMIKSIHADTEHEVIFKVCQWVYSKKEINDNNT